METSVSPIMVEGLRKVYEEECVVWAFLGSLKKEGRDDEESAEGAGDSGEEGVESDVE